ISRLGIAAVAALALLPQTAGPGGAATTAATCAPTTTPTGAPFPGGEWRSYGHDYANTRTQDQETTITPSVAKTLAPAWTFSSTSVHATGDFTGTPVVADGCVYVCSNGGWVFALNADTGALVWRTQVTTKGGVDSSLNVSGGRVYAGVAVVGSPSAVALDEATGAVLWQTQLDAQPGADEFASPVVFNNLVFLGVSGGAAELSDTKVRYPFEGSFVLLDATTGAVVKKTYTIHP